MKTNSFFIAFLTSLATIGAFIFICDRTLHWFLVPLFLCGITIGSDAVDWIRGKLDVFDPIGITGILGYHLFFLSPLLHTYLDHYLRSITDLPSDWRDWFGYMAYLNFVGLILYRYTRHYFIGIFTSRWKRTYWTLNGKQFTTILPFFLLITLALQIQVYMSYGGILGYIQAYEARSGEFQNMGWIFLVSESFPILALMGFGVYKNMKSRSCSTLTIFLVIVAFLLLSLFFGGLRGSRSNTIFKVVWAVGILHYWVRPLTKKQFFAGFIFLLIFMYFYGFYKAKGSEMIRMLQKGESMETLEDETGRTWEKLLLGDLSRSDVQAYLLYRTFNSDYQIAMGRTYIGALSLMIPRFIVPNRPPTKIKEGTEVQFGVGMYMPNRLQASQVYGLAGEAILNFGAIGVPLSFLVLSLVVSLIHVRLSTLDPNDARWLTMPFWSCFGFILLVSDSDNLIFYIGKNYVLPLFLIFINSKRKKV